MPIIIVPLDGSEFAERAIGFARILAEATDAQVILAQAVERPWAAMFPPDLPTLLEQSAERYLHDAAARLGAGGVATRVLRGNPTDELLAFTKQHADATIVMSSHGRGGIGRAVFGSVADKVVRGAVTPVVVVPVASSGVAGPLSDVAVPLDGSPLAESALPHAVALARATGATLRLVRVVVPVWESFYMYGAPEVVYVSDAQATQLQQEADTAARDYLKSVERSLGELPGGVVRDARAGRPAGELLRLAEELPHGMFVMATHGRGGFRRWALGSVTTEVTQRGSIPVMVVPSATTQDRPDASGGANGGETSPTVD